MSSQPNTQLDFNLGAEVHCMDGQCGTLAKVVINPRTDRVTGLIIERGFLFKENRVVPLGIVAEASPDEVRLTITSDELARHRKYEEETYRAPEPGWKHGQYTSNNAVLYKPPYRVPMTQSASQVKRHIEHGIAGSLDSLEAGLPVHGITEQLGTLDHVVADEETGEITALVVESGLLFGDYRIVPAERIEYIDDEGARVALEAQAFEALPEYRSKEA